jgi:hypothetical protein
MRFRMAAGLSAYRSAACLIVMYRECTSASGRANAANGGPLEIPEADNLSGKVARSSRVGEP